MSCWWNSWNGLFSPSHPISPNNEAHILGFIWANKECSVHLIRSREPTLACLCFFSFSFSFSLSSTPSSLKKRRTKRRKSVRYADRGPWKSDPMTGGKNRYDRWKMKDTMDFSHARICSSCCWLSSGNVFLENRCWRISRWLWGIISLIFGNWENFFLAKCGISGFGGVTCNIKPSLNT